MEENDSKNDLKVCARNSAGSVQLQRQDIHVGK